MPTNFIPTLTLESTSETTGKRIATIDTLSISPLVDRPFCMDQGRTDVKCYKLFE